MPHRKTTDPVQALEILLRNPLDRHETHVGALNRFADRFGVNFVVLVAFDVRLNELRRDQPDVMIKLAKFPGPMMSASTSFHAHETGLQSHHELCQLFPCQRLSEHRLSMRSNAVQVKRILAQVDSERRDLLVYDNLLHGSLRSSLDGW